MSRQKSAYLTPASIILGIALHDIFSSLVLLCSKAPEANKTIIWRVASVSWIFLASFFVCQTMVVDWLTSPYIVPDYWFGLLQVLNYSLNFLTTLGVGTMFLLRINVFYGYTSRAFVSMFVLFLVVVVFKGLGDGYGIAIGWDVLRLKYLRYDLHPQFLNEPRYMAVAHVAEACFAFVGSVSFFYAIGKGLGKTTAQIVYDIILKHDGLRLIGIVGIDLLIAIFGVYNSIWQSTYITHVVFYLPTWAYALQFGTFLQHSYVEVKNILQQHSDSSEVTNGNSESSNTFKVLDPVQP